jgi:hypothetical protein
MSYFALAGITTANTTTRSSNPAQLKGIRYRPGLMAARGPALKGRLARHDDLAVSRSVYNAHVKENPGRFWKRKANEDWGR